MTSLPYHDTLRELARTLEHAADWIGEGWTIPENIDR